ncbi:MAG: YwqG family protein [Pirellulaceae bacterium]
MSVIPMATILTSLGWIAVVVLGLAAIIVIVCIPHNLRVRRVRRIGKALPNEVKDRVLALIEETAAKGPSVTFLRLDEERQFDKGDVLLTSHVGGVPYAEVGDEWPQGEPAKFILQVRLNEPSLGPRWQGRLLVVFFLFDFEQVVRSYANPRHDKYQPLHSSETPYSLVPLVPLRMPAESTDEHLPASPRRLCEMIPAVSEPLSGFTTDQPGVLTQILRPNLYGYDLDAPDIAYVGGDPMLIQNPHDPVCDQCGKPMRFLFQFGEIIPGLQMADAGVCYIYGCDDHPERCKGFVDSH